MRSVLLAVTTLAAFASSVFAQDVIEPKSKPSFGDRLKQMTPQERDAELNRIFNEFDKNRDGHITVDEAPHLPPEPGQAVNPAAEIEDAKFFISLYDTNEDRKVSLSEYRAKAAAMLLGLGDTDKAIREKMPQDRK
ncbi:EF-hand domain-containing protein [Asticcacaulis sp. BYS171W]|uniref:EF-hand domain-containing protein n=1 Tax=Asticcacaulis aquaticus TaxID=2984212 RepID=A0ABT5HSR5_9CAUL|nr:EF-hand domain-containing protein [Asticcacaulis aquaticus]MDC7683096.1 EF-hand domain-containing protein [Asticcacaulis aquaticus]